MRLIEAQKNIETPKRLGKLSTRKSNSLSCIDELIINVDDLNDGDNFTAPDYCNVQGQTPAAYAYV